MASMFRCAIIGTGTLPLQCGDVLRARGHDVRLIVAPASDAGAWAARHGVAHAPLSAQLGQALSAHELDFIFSVVNPRVLSAEILAAPRRGTINYHDSLLPAYAGVHATTWAILHGEVEHGISWHEVTERIDAGRILKQARVAVAPDDTAFSLNTKCYEAAVTAFDELLSQLESGTVRPMEQDPSRRSYYGRDARPRAAGVIDWTRPPRQIDALVRALQLGPYANAVATAKILLDDRVLVCGASRVLESAKAAAPGTVLCISDDELHVAAAGGAVALHELRSLDGTPVSMSELAALGLAVGTRLPALDSTDVDAVSALAVRSARAESFWIERLAAPRAPTLPFGGSLDAGAAEPRFETRSIDIPADFAERSDCAAIIATAFAAFVARLGNESAFDIAIDVPVDPTCKSAGRLFATRVPLAVAPDLDAPIDANVAAFQSALSLVRSRGTYARDLVARAPALRGRPPELLPVAILSGASESAMDADGGDVVALILRADGSASLRIDRERVCDATAQLLTDGFAAFLNDASARRDVACGRLAVMSAGVRERVMRDSRPVADDAPTYDDVLARFARVVQSHPDDAAVSGDDATVTYAELDDRSTRLASSLRRAGVTRDVRVGIFLERSTELVVAVLAVLKASGTYVPLDPDAPADRVAFVLNDADARVVITDKGLRASLPETSAAIVIAGADDAAIAAETEPPRLDADEGGLAYVLYTSGSTGRPKGVMVTRRALANFAGWASTLVELTSSDVVLFKTPFTFDPSGEEMFLALTTGARLVVARHGAHNDLAYVLELMARERVTVVIFIPSALLVSATLPGFERACRALRHVSCGGEALTGAHVAALHAAAPDALVLNLYGPTEATIAAAGYEVPRGREFDAVPFGRAVPGMRTYVVDRRGELVPPGVTGELWLAGVQVARGYVNHPELTAERFGTDPFDDASTALYRTGDLVSRTADGMLQFVGRADNQIKIRGYRVELGEIEAVVREHTDVAAAAVVVRGAGEQAWLAAYVAPSSGASLDTASIAAFVARRLPAHMVPSAFVALDAIPLTPNGKLDTRALPEPRRAATEGVAPRSDRERQLHAIWAELLGTSAFGVRDDLFALGANSLVAMRALGRIAERFGRVLPLHTVFDSPTIEALSDTLASDGKDALNHPDAIEIGGPIRTDASNAPLAFAQELLWLDAQAHPDRVTYHIADRIDVRGPLDVDAFVVAVQDLVDANAALRTSFVLTSDGPRQIVADRVAATVETVDLRHLPVSDAALDARARCDAHARAPFDLARAPLIKVLVTRVTDELTLVGVVQHHIVSDGWSRVHVLRQLGDAYSRRLANQSQSVRGTEVEYVDFAAWQRERAERGGYDAGLSFWREALATASPVLDLPTDYARPPVSTGKGDVVTTTWPTSTLDATRALGQQHGTTLFMTLLAAFEAVLSRYARQSAFVVGTPVSGRIPASTEPLVGYFANMLPLVADVSGDPTFDSLLGRVREQCLGAFDHQDVPFALIVAAAGRGADPSRTPLFQVMFSLQNTDPVEIEIRNATTTIEQAPTDTAKFDLWLSVTETDEGLALSVEYRTDLFARATIESLVDNMHALVRDAVRTPEAHVRSLALVGDVERAALDAWNATDAAATGPATIHALFERSARETPDAVAVVCETDHLTYAELDASANRLAHRLRDGGVRRGDLVGVCIERSLDLVVALLAVMKAGAAYVPLDPTYPRERLDLMVRDASPRLIVTQRALAMTIAPDVPLVVVDDERGVVDDAPTTPLGVDCSGDDVAYVIYTSGSTGVPKGAILPHRAVVNYLQWMCACYDFSAADRVLQKAPVSFDASVWELYVPLVAGATLVLARADGHRDPLYLMGTIASHRITMVQFVPSMLAAVLETPGFATACATVRALFLGGEPLPADLVARIRATLPGVPVHNLYGPTEAAVYATAYTLPAALPPGPISIGAPISNVQVHVLDPSGSRVPIGVPGELFIGGAGVGVGYLNRPELTAERFVADPFRSSRHARMYRTGDLARWKRDGTLEFLGRGDDQVKVRGFRVELGEVERAMTSLPRIRECAVIRWGSDGADAQLVAYVVADGAAPTIAELRAALAGVLPEYMIPSAVEVLDALPLGVTGKLDRRALPAPRITASTRDFIGPRTPLEQRIVATWKDVLGRDRVGIRDEFFELGGHSLLAMRIMLRLSAELGSQLPVRLVFEHRTVEALAAAIERLADANGPDDDVEDLLTMLEQLSDEDAQRQIAMNPAQS